MKKILIGTHNNGKFKEISYLLSKKIKKISPNKLNIASKNITIIAHAAKFLPILFKFFLLFYICQYSCIFLVVYVQCELLLYYFPNTHSSNIIDGVQILFVQVL